MTARKSPKAEPDTEVPRQVAKREATAELLDSAETLTQIVDGNSIPTFVINRRHTIAFWNKALERLSGLSSGEMLGTGGQWKAFYPGPRPVLADIVMDERPEDEIATFYAEKCRKSSLVDDVYEAEDFFPHLGDGDGKWMFFTAVPLKDRRGQIIGAVETLQDVTERKRAEETLLEKEKQIELALRGGDLGTWDWYLPTKEVRFNERWATMKGYSPDEIEPHLRSWESRVHPNDLPGVMEKLNAHLEGKTPFYEAEFRMRHKSGQWVWITDKGKVIERDANGNPVRACGTHLDITDRKRAEEALRLFSHSVASSIDGIAMGDIEYRITYVNEAFVRMFGYSREELVGKEIARIYAEDQIPKLKEALETALEGSWRGELIGKRKNGELFPMAVSSSRVLDDEGKLIAHMTTHRDITERKQAEQALRESQQKLDAMLNCIGAHMSMMDENLTMLWANKIAKDMFGEDVVGKKCYEVYHQRTEPCEPYPCITLRAFEDGKTHRHETEVIAKDGHRIYFHCTANVALTDNNGKPTAVLEISRDITERKQAEEELVHAKHAAEAANRAKSEFLANMSHEIRTPMTSIMGYTDLLMAHDMPFAERHEYLETVHRNAENLLAIINDILDLSKIEAERIELEPVDCSPRQIVEEVLSLMRVRAIEKKLGLDVDYVFPLPETIRTDPIRLRQILLNLVGNALKFTDSGGVRITVRCTSGENTPPRMQFEVTDTGIGMTAEDMSGLFQPFTQVDMSSTRRFGGTGLGLSISQRLAKLLGGQIDAQSQPGRGSTFTVTIDPGPLEGVPMLEATTTGAVEEEAAPACPAERFHGRILLAEDGQDIQQLIGFYLQQSGLEMDLAENGRIACEKAAASQAKREPYDLILMDIRMPELNGYEATRRLRRDGWQGPIVAFTAHAMVGDREKCLEAGCDDYLAKPVSYQQLQDTLARYLG